MFLEPARVLMKFLIDPSKFFATLSGNAVSCTCNQGVKVVIRWKVSFRMMSLWSLVYSFHYWFGDESRTLKFQCNYFIGQKYNYGLLCYSFYWMLLAILCWADKFFRRCRKKKDKFFRHLMQALCKKCIRLCIAFSFTTFGSQANTSARVLVNNSDVILARNPMHMKPIKRICNMFVISRFSINLSTLPFISVCQCIFSPV